MQINVYGWEQFVRTTWRYVIAGILFAIVIALALVGGNILQWWENLKLTRQSVFGAIVLLGLARWYRSWSHYQDQQVVVMYMGEAWLTLGNRTITWNLIKWFGIEINKNTQELRNLVLVTFRGNEIHTFADTQESIKTFIEELNGHIPYIENVSLSWIDKVTRKLKL